MVDALLFTEAWVVCPANWQEGGKAMAPNTDGLKAYLKN